MDLLAIETMMAINETEQAISAAKQVAPDVPLLAMVTVDEDANCLDGTPAEVAAARLTAAGADAIGCNCSTGPATVLTAIERMRAATDLPLVAMPNAGMPRNVDGRNIYLCSPEYMASFARKFVRAGVQFIGGCCGTTPNHIRAMKSAIRAMDAQQTYAPRHSSTPIVTETPPAPLADRSKIGSLVASGEFITLVEIVPPRGIDCSKEIEGARMLAGTGIHAINIPDSPRASARMSAQSLCLQIQQQTGIETVLHYTCRDRNLLSIQSDLLGASSLGLRNILCLTGDPPKLGNYPDATAVFDVDAIGLVNVVNRLNHGLDIGGNPIGASTGFTLGVAANPGVPDIENEIRRFAYKVEAGGEYAITQPVFDLRLLEVFLKRIEELPHSGDRRHLAAHQSAQCGVHEERSARLHAGRDHGSHGSNRNPGGGACRRHPHRTGDAERGTPDGAGSAGERALRTLCARSRGRSAGAAADGRIARSIENRGAARRSYSAEAG